MNRRLFVGSSVLAATSMRPDLFAAESSVKGGVFVGAGADRRGAPLATRIPTLCKISGDDTAGGMYVFEHVNLPRGGPFRHLHLAQDEWFYVTKGEFRFEVGDDAFSLGPGDSIYAPRNLPHVWASVGDTPGNLVLIVTPAGQLEAFFRAQAAFTGAPERRVLEDLFRSHGMRLVGEPLKV